MKSTLFGRFIRLIIQLKTLLFHPDFVRHSCNLSLLGSHTGLWLSWVFLLRSSWLTCSWEKFTCFGCIPRWFLNLVSLNIYSILQVIIEYITVSFSYLSDLLDWSDLFNSSKSSVYWQELWRSIYFLGLFVRKFQARRPKWSTRLWISASCPEFQSLLPAVPSLE